MATKFLNLSTDTTLGGVSPSDEIAVSQKAIKTYVDNQGGGGADTSLSNLTSAGKNIGNWSSNVSNCITEIPQDIKLELNNGTLTLKAGSKVYVPNGAGVFNEVTVDSDKTASVSSFSGFVFYRSDNNSFHLEALQPTSGTTPPSGDGTWYDTSANKIKRYENSSFVYDGISFPLCKISSGSIDYVFNGFGYIGSTVYAVPGVKGLISNGRNADGTLKNTEFTVSSVLTRTGTASGKISFPLNASGFDYIYTSDIEYNKDRNFLVNLTNNTAMGSSDVLSVVAGSGGTINSFTAKTVIHPLDYSDTEFIVHQAMPSNTYINLTLGASGTTYTMPADGYLFCEIDGVSGNYINFEINSNMHSMFVSPSNYTDWSRGFVPVAKGQSVRINYGGTSSGTKRLVFICAQGTK